MARSILGLGLILSSLSVLCPSDASPTPLERSKRQDISALLGLLNQGGTQAAGNGQSGSNPLIDLVKGYAVKKVLGEGAMGQLIGSSLGFGDLYTTTTPAPGFFDRLFGRATTLPPPTTTTTTQAAPGFWKKLFGGASATTETTTTTTTTTTPEPGIWDRILSFGKGSSSAPAAPNNKESVHVNQDVDAGSSRDTQHLPSATQSTGFLSSLANQFRQG
ncbi:hypothetical protein RvY_05746 [Ramazzottius varieornatus]|uniref:Uncharacterized protein n=1 Tax=Ramazzottius varieornatus TaxID=947166 RepID=A0A1D1UW42_RAMVA|nr:hypothetical protein RvY_05746 [Ramazzottius varieornatus]